MRLLAFLAYKESDIAHTHHSADGRHDRPLYTVLVKN